MVCGKRSHQFLHVAEVPEAMWLALHCTRAVLHLQLRNSFIIKYHVINAYFWMNSWMLFVNPNPGIKSAQNRGMITRSCASDVQNRTDTSPAWVWWLPCILTTFSSTMKAAAAIPFEEMKEGIYICRSRSRVLKVSVVECWLMLLIDTFERQSLDTPSTPFLTLHGHLGQSVGSGLIFDQCKWVSWYSADYRPAVDQG